MKLVFGFAVLLGACSPDASQANNVAVNVTTAAAPVAASVKPPVKGLKPFEQDLAQAAWDEANSKCRGGPGDDNDTYLWCNIRALLQTQVLTPNNRCYDGESTASSTWRSCSAESRAMKLADNWYEEGGPAPTTPPLTRAYLNTRVHFNNPARLAQFAQKGCSPEDTLYWGPESFLRGNVFGMQDSEDFAIVLPWTDRFFVIAYWAEGEEASVDFSLVERCS